MRQAMAALNLAPGAALLDLTFRRRDHRRFALRIWAMWLAAMVLYVASSNLPLVYVADPWEYSLFIVLSFSGGVALGGSVAVGMSTIVGWAVMFLIGMAIGNEQNARGLEYFGLYLGRLFGSDTPFYVAAVVALLAGLRFPRQQSARRSLATMVASLPLVIALWVVTQAIASVVFAAGAPIALGVFVRDLARVPEYWPDAWSIAKNTPFYLAGVAIGQLWYSFAAMAALIAAEAIRTRRVSARAPCV
jgi:hypothetical protein